jgi:aspartyl-tRNA synthetase
VRQGRRHLWGPRIEDSDDGEENVLRTHEAGGLRADHTGQTVTLAGWVASRRDHGGVAFLDLRDASGTAQVVVRDELLESSGAHGLRNEFCIRITGEVRGGRR